MGKRNQQRRAEKRRQRQRQGRSGSGSSSRIAGGWARPPSVEEALEAAVEANWHEDPGLEMVLAFLGDMATVPGGARVGVVVSGRLQRAVRGCWARGWQPADLAGVVGRKLGAAHRGLCIEVIAAEAGAYVGVAVAPDPGWLSQLDELGASGSAGTPFQAGGRLDVSGPLLRRSVELIGMLEHAPALPQLGPSPSEWGCTPRRSSGGCSSPQEARLLARVRALLTKAESTHFPEEAEALTAKAQELMARHAIDRAAVEGGGQPTVEGRRLRVEDPYAQAKAILLQTVAEANRCRSVWSQDMGFCTVFGAPDELRITDLLYTSLLTQATTAMVAAGSRGRQARLPSFRNSFVVAFAHRVGERLRQAVGAEVDAGTARHGKRLLPVLARRVQAVDEAVDAAFPGMTERVLRTSNGFGWAAGRAAADLADLAVGERLGKPA